VKWSSDRPLPLMEFSMAMVVLAFKNMSDDILF